MNSWRYGLLTLMSFMIAATCFAADKADHVVVVKSQRILYLYTHQQIIATYHVTFGGNPIGHKQQAADGRTPEGHYLLDTKNAHSAYYKSLHVSYPNQQDIAAARQRGVSAGGDIMIHGQKNGYSWAGWVVQRFNWTKGCIALSNADMDKVWDAVDAGTPIEIKP